MFLKRIELRDFRNYGKAKIKFPEQGVVVLMGRNGHGKTNLLEAIGYVTSLHSFRSPSNSAMVRNSTEKAILRAEGVREDRELLVETEIAGSSGRSRTLVNKQALKKSSDISKFFASVVFSPDDLQLVKGGPSLRRDYVDNVLASCDIRMAALQHDVERVLKQRNTLLRQANGRVTSDVEHTLDVWDERLVSFGEALGRERAEMIEELRPFIEESYVDIADSETSSIGLALHTEWRSEDGHKGLAHALKAARTNDIARGITSVGPHRDEVELSINNMPARSHASQGEQRTYALALRLAAYRYMTEILEDPPILLLDDVFSELDHGRCRRLLGHLAGGQMFLTTATDLPSGVEWAAKFRIEHGKIAV